MSLFLRSKLSEIHKHLFFMILVKWAFLGGSIKLKRVHELPIFFTFFKSYDPNIRKKDNFLTFQFVIKIAQGVFNVLKQFQNSNKFHYLQKNVPLSNGLSRTLETVGPGLNPLERARLVAHVIMSSGQLDYKPFSLQREPMKILLQTVYMYVFNKTLESIA